MMISLNLGPLIAYAFGSAIDSFHLFNLLPSHLIPHDYLVSELPLDPPSVLVFELSDSAPDPLQFYMPEATAANVRLIYCGLVLLCWWFRKESCINS